MSSFIHQASVDQLETRDSGCSACPVGEPHPGQAIVGLTPRLAACGSGCIGLICMPGLKTAMQGSWVNIGFESWRKNVKMLNSIDFPPLLFVSVAKGLVGH